MDPGRGGPALVARFGIKTVDGEVLHDPVRRRIAAVGGRLEWDDSRQDPALRLQKSQRGTAFARFPPSRFRESALDSPAMTDVCLIAPGTIRHLALLLLLGLGAACGGSGAGADDDRAGKAGSGAGAGTGGAAGEVGGSSSAAGKATSGSGGAGGFSAGTGGAETAGEGGGGGSAGANMGGGGSGGSDAGGGGAPLAGGTSMGGAGAGGSGTAGAGGGGELVNMFVMFDRSGSMNECADGTDFIVGEPCASPPSRWDLASFGLHGFFRDPAAAGLGVALRFFPHDLPALGCDGGQTGACDSAACAVPLVDVARLTADPAPTDSHEALLGDAIDGSVPLVMSTSGGTPIYPALEGALIWAVTRQAGYPDETTVVVFVTDGEPNGCNEDWDAITQLSADALASSNVRTFAVGLTDLNGAGVSMADMDSLASAGGTQQAYFVSDSPDASAELLAALNAIRSRI